MKDIFLFLSLYLLISWWKLRNTKQQDKLVVLTNHSFYLGFGQVFYILHDWLKYLFIRDIKIIKILPNSKYIRISLNTF